MPQAFSVFYQTSLNTNLTEWSTNVQSVSVSRGRQWGTDPFSPSSCTIVTRGTPPAAIGGYVLVVTGDYAGGQLIATNQVVFLGTVKDQLFNYGIKSSMDVTVLTLEGTLARWGRRNFTSRAISQNTTLAQISTVATAIGYDTFTTIAGTGQSIASAQTYVGNGLDLVNTLMQTEVGYIRETGGYLSPPGIPLQLELQPNVVFAQRNYDTVSDFTFADDSTVDGIRYDDIQFNSAAQNYYTEVTINPLGLAAQTSGSGFYNLTQESYDYTTAQALSHAQYLKSQYNTTASNPVSITASYANQDTATRLTEFQGLLNTARCNAGLACTVIFRNKTYECIVEGVQIDSDPSETTITVTLSAFDNNNYLILNNAVFGTLGTSGTYPGNKLGF
jgi:hypothetical protein